MAVRIVPVGMLKPVFPGGRDAFEAEAGQTTGQLLAQLRIDSDLVAMVLINGRQSAKDAVLRDGDVVKLIPFVGGG